MNDEYREGVVKENMEEAKKIIVSAKPGFNKGQFYADAFNKVWRAFDAYINSEFPNRNVFERLNGFVSTYFKWYLKEYKNLPDNFKVSIDELSKYEIEDMTPGSIKSKIKINDKTNLKQVTDVIYRIRCNLDHGGKQMSEEKNVILVERAFYLLYELIDKVLRKEGVLN
jgi:hypothetical protein